MTEHNPMPRPRGTSLITAAVVAAVLFGVVTVLAGARVRLGADPGYVVYQPLLLFNTLMGVAYVAVGIVAWRRPRLDVYGAGAVLVLNAIALSTTAYLYTANGPIASESIRAMAFRTVAWLALLLALVVGTRRGSRS